MEAVIGSPCLLRGCTWAPEKCAIERKTDHTLESDREVTLDRAVQVSGRGTKDPARLCVILYGSEVASSPSAGKV